MINTTIVTGIWDLGRSNLSEGWSRNFDHYINNFKKLLSSLGEDVPVIVFIDKEHEDIVWSIRNRANTAVYHQNKDGFSGNFFPFFDKVQKIRTNNQWLDQTGWLRDSTQAKMELYNPMVMSKMFMLHNAKIFNPFNTEYMFWLDGGITNTVHEGYFSHDKIIHKLEKITDKFLFVTFPYETNTEIHGFKIEAMNRYSKSNVNRVARGGLFGGHIDYISEANGLYYSLLNDSLNEGLMGTEESIFTIMTYLDEDIYKFHMIENNGLIYKFFEDIKNIPIENIETIKNKNRKKYENNDVLLYINTFNSPEQLQMVLDSFEKYDNNFLNKTKKILINNSTKDNLQDKYDNICQKYNFIEHIQKGNLGICGARQFSAEDFNNKKSKYMMFFEDDMLLDLSKNVCNVGLSKYVNNIYDNIIKIMNKEQYDFLKFSFAEFFGHNGEQWSWHNLPSEQKMKYFGPIKKKPNTNIKHIKTFNNVPYAEGEIYYSNWPHIIDQEGNQKLFLDTKWDNPFEQTWMSHIYTLTKKDIVKSAILLASPITHNRVHFYEGHERREN
jgi:hypothetical protein